MDPLDILPEEMWANIFGKLTEAQDWLNLYRSSPSSSFAKTFEKDRVVALFPAVFSILHSYLEQELEELQEMLQLRQVCRQWRTAVDWSIETNRSKYSERVQESYKFVQFPYIPSFLELFPDENHTQFRRKLKNPIIGRSVEFDCRYYGPLVTNGEPIRKYVGAMVRFVERFGDQIHRLKISGGALPLPRPGGGGDDMLDFHLFGALLQNILLQTPNLSELTVGLEEFRPPPPPTGSISSLKVVQEVPGGFHQDQPPPAVVELSNLGYFECYYVGGSSSKGAARRDWFLAFAIGMCGKEGTRVKRANLGGLPSSSGLAGGPAGVIIFPNLNNLSLMIRSKQEMFRLSDHHSSWPLLSKLTLTLPQWAANEDEQVGVREVFGSIIGNFGGTLKELELEIANLVDDIGDNDTEFRVDMPALKCLRMIGNFVPPTSYFMNLPRLESLQFILPGGRHSPIEGFYSSPEEYLDALLKGMIETGIWESAPSLSRVEFEHRGAGFLGPIRVFSREDWNEHKKRKRLG